MSFLQYFDIHITIVYLNLNLFVFCMFVAETAFFNLTESVKKEKTIFFYGARNLQKVDWI